MRSADRSGHYAECNRLKASPRSPDGGRRRAEPGKTQEAHTGGREAEVVVTRGSGVWVGQATARAGVPTQRSQERSLNQGPLFLHIRQRLGNEIQRCSPTHCSIQNVCNAHVTDRTGTDAGRRQGSLKTIQRLKELRHVRVYFPMARSVPRARSGRVSFTQR